MAVFKISGKKKKEIRKKEASVEPVFYSANTYLAFLHLEKLEKIYF